MSDRFNALTVVLDKDIRSEDAEPLMAAIRQLKGVLSVQGNVSSFETAVAEARVRRQLADALFDVIYERKKAPTP